MKNRLFGFLFSFIKLKWRVMGFLGLQTLGVRILVVRQNLILLVKHTYTPGWYLPGGTIEKNESALQAAVREINEEVGIIPKTPPTLFGFYHNPSYGRDDYVATYLCEDFTENPKVPCHEIAELKWFDVDNLPEDISPGTQRRILEYLGKAKKSDQL